MTHLYDIFETRFKGPTGSNPYLDLTFYGYFSQGNRKVRVTGFHDGGEDYLLRFMPDTIGEWTFVTASSVAELDGQSGSVTVSSAREGVHGPVRVRNRFHFAYDDNTPYYPFGTTCYAWTHQPLEMQECTLASLKTSGFNKIRMAVFPKDYPFNTNEPLQPMFMDNADGTIDFDRPNPVAFRHLENADRPSRRTGHRSRPDPFPSLRSVGLCNHVGGAEPALRGIRGGTIFGLPERLVGAGQ
jgi:hypothetical protein